MAAKAWLHTSSCVFWRRLLGFRFRSQGWLVWKAKESGADPNTKIERIDRRWRLCGTVVLFLFIFIDWLIGGLVDERAYSGISQTSLIVWWYQAELSRSSKAIYLSMYHMEERATWTIHVAVSSWECINGNLAFRRGVSQSKHHVHKAPPFITVVFVCATKVLPLGLRPPIR